jgi:hypothetical protein
VLFRSIFGREFILREPVREEFEAAGAHRDKCTSVIAMALYMLIKVFDREEIGEKAKGNVHEG